LQIVYIQASISNL